MVHKDYNLDHNITYVCYKDLLYAYDELIKEKESPKRLRRKFANFVYLAQQLTGAMRKEYPKRTAGLKWDARYGKNSFTGWDSVSDVFKSIRNDGQHESSIFIQVRRIYYYAVDSTCSQFVAFAATPYNIDPFLDELKEEGHYKLYLADEQTGEMTDRVINYHHMEYRFAIVPANDDTKKLLDIARNDDLYELSERYLNTLKNYYDFYEKSIQENRVNLSNCG